MRLVRQISPYLIYMALVVVFVRVTKGSWLSALELAILVVVVVPQLYRKIDRRGDGK